MATSKPWVGITTGSARRVDATHVADFFWSRSHDNHIELLLDFPTPEQLPRVPALRGVQCGFEASKARITRLRLRLIDSTLDDVFLSLCEDVIQSSSSAISPLEAAHISVQRTWRWHHLLRGGSSDILTPAEQLGLLGELAMLKKLVVEVSAREAVEGWHGPFGAAKDFTVRSVGIEVKARRANAAFRVTIHGAEQLEALQEDELWLSISDYTLAESGYGQSLTEAVVEMVATMGSTDASVLSELENRVLASGFSYSHDYSPWRWTPLDSRLFAVTSDFPRIVASNLPAGITAVRYDLDLNHVSQFQRDWSVLSGDLANRKESQ